VTVQALDYQLLRQELIEGGGLLEWPANLPPAQPAFASADFNDHATVPANFRFSTSGAGFTGQWDGTGTGMLVAGDLTYSGGGYAIVQAPGANPGKIQGNYNEPRQNTRSLASTLEGDVWLSFLVNNPNGNARAGLSLNPGTNGDPAQGPIERLLVLTGGTLSFQANGATLATSPDALAVGQTHLILAKLRVELGNDVLSVWADPVDLANLREPDLRVAGQDLFESLSALGLLTYNPDGPAFSAQGGYLDAIRVSNQSDGFARVTGVPEPGVGGAMVIAAIAVGSRRRKRVA
jgi:hypothetical protein